MSLTTRQPMRPCGRPYGSEDEALRSKRGQSGNYLPVVCLAGCPPGTVHLRRKPAPAAVTRKPASDTSPHSFPPAACELIDRRDSDHDGTLPVRLCQMCGTTRDPQRHHRRGKDAGGSEDRAHTHCPCNGVTLCGPGGNGCHQWAHAHPHDAQAQGYIVSQSVDEPGSAGVMRFASAEGGGTQWPSCDGRWLESAPEMLEVA